MIVLSSLMSGEGINRMLQYKPVLLGRYSDEKEPILCCVRSVVDDLRRQRVSVRTQIEPWVSLKIPDSQLGRSVCQRSWLVVSLLPCSSGRQLSRSPGRSCSRRSTSRRSRRRPSCGLSSWTSSQCWRFGESFALQKGREKGVRSQILKYTAVLYTVLCHN